MKSNADFSIFLVDDDPFFLNLCEQYLHNLGFTAVRKYESSTGFLNELLFQPGLIFLDYNLDSLNGIETLKKIKRFNPNFLVVFISGQEKIDVAVNALKYGAFDYLLKEEVTEDRLKIVLDKAIAIKTVLEKRNKKSLFMRLLPLLGLAAIILLVYKFFYK